MKRKERKWDEKIGKEMKWRGKEIKMKWNEIKWNKIKYTNIILYTNIVYNEYKTRHIKVSSLYGYHY